MLGWRNAGGRPRITNVNGWPSAEERPLIHFFLALARVARSERLLMCACRRAVPAFGQVKHSGSQKIMPEPPWRLVGIIWCVEMAWANSGNRSVVGFGVEMFVPPLFSLLRKVHWFFRQPTISSL
jgi:hypothetical protein